MRLTDLTDSQQSCGRPHISKSFSGVSPINLKQSKVDPFFDWFQEHHDFKVNSQLKPIARQQTHINKSFVAHDSSFTKKPPVQNQSQ